MAIKRINHKFHPMYGQDTSVPTYIDIDVAADTSEEIIPESTGKRIMIHEYAITAETADGTIQFSDNSFLSGIMTIADNQTITSPFNPCGWFIGEREEGINIETTGCSIKGHVVYSYTNYPPASIANNLQSILGNTLFEFDFTNANSWDGSDLTNLTTTPNDGVSSSADWVATAQGTGNTFNGSVGDADAYYSLNGSGYLQISSNPDTVDTWHTDKSEYNKSFWLSILVRKPTLAEGTLFATGDSTDGVLVVANPGGDADIRATVYTDSTVSTADSGINISANEWVLITINWIWSPTVPGVNFLVNSSNTPVLTAGAATSANPAEYALCIGSQDGSVNLTGDIKWIAGGLLKHSNEIAEDIMEYLNPKHNLSLS